MATGIHLLWSSGRYQPIPNTDKPEWNPSDPYPTKQEGEGHCMLALGFIGTRLTLQKPITVHNGPHQQPTRPIKHDERTNRGSTTPQESRADPRRTLTKILNSSHEQTAPEREDSAPHSHADPVQQHLHEGRVTGGHNPTHPRSPPRTGHMDTPGDPQGHICLIYTSPSPRASSATRMPSSA